MLESLPAVSSRPKLASSTMMQSSNTWGRIVVRQTRSFSYIPMAPPPLFDLCVRRSFDEALERAQTHPHEAKFKHPRNWTALHCCVEHVAPLSVVKAIYKAHPESLTTKDWQGITPEEAAVDPETKEFLRQALQDVRKSHTTNNSNIIGDEKKGNTATSATASVAANNNSNDPMLLGKVLVHANNLSEQVSELNSKTEKLQKEIDELKATLRAMSAK